MARIVKILKSYVGDSKYVYFSQRLASMTLWCIGRYGDYIVQ